MSGLADNAPAAPEPEHALARVVADAYRVFSKYIPNDPPIVCACCVDDQFRDALGRTPLRAVSAELLGEYTQSAHGWDEAIERDMKYFLPRYLDLMAEGWEPDFLGVPQTLRRLANVDWRRAWPRAEVDVLERFFVAFAEDYLADDKLVLWPAGWRPRSDMKDALALCVTAGGDVRPLLDAWRRFEGVGRALHVANLRRSTRLQDGAVLFESPFMEREYRESAWAIGGFLAEPEQDDVLENAFFATRDERLQTLLSAAMWR